MRRSFATLFVLTVLSMILAACAPTSTPTSVITESTTAAADPTIAPVGTTAAPAEPTAAPVSGSAIELPEVDPSTVSGDINTAGSSTVYPLAEVLADDFKKDGFAGNVNLASVGTGGGFERFCKTGETDISNASRAIKTSEAD